MSLVQASVKRPVFVVMITLIIMILGGIALWRLPIDLMPDITNPTISISTSYENASPEEIEELITRPIEEAMSAVPGVIEVSSNSTEGRSNVRVTFDWGYDLDAASNDIRDRLDRIIGRLPDDADRPVLRKFDLAAFPILILGASSNLDPVQMRQLIEDEIKYRIERVPGVASLDIWGGLNREIHVDLNPDKIKALGLALNQILDRIRSGNVNIPAGTLDRGNWQVTIRVPGEFDDLNQLRNTVVAMRDGVPVHLSEVADVEDSWEKVRQIARVNGRPGFRLSVNKQSGKNTVEVAEAVLKEIEQVNADLPQIHVIPIIDSSDYIRRSINNVGTAAVFGGLLSVIVLLVFLRNLSSTLVIGIAIPVSIVATFSLMYFGNLTLNLMTLGGLALGVGMLLDNSIVVLENIYRLREEGVEAGKAAVEGTSEVVSAIVASTLTTVVVFLPLVFMRGMAGIMFKQLSFVIGFALLCSMVVAVTLVPMLSARVLRSPQEMSAGTGWRHRIFRATGAMFRHLEDGYKRILSWALDHRLVVGIIAVSLLAGSLALVPLVGSELMPATDEGEVRIEAEMDVGTRLELTEKKALEIEAILVREVPEMESMVVSVGGGFGASGSHTAQARVALKPLRERTRSSEDVASALRRKLAGIPGVTIRTRAGEGMGSRMTRMSMGGSERMQVEVRGFDLQTAEELAARVRKELEQVEGITDTRVSREAGTPEDLVVVDRVRAADMKLTVTDVANALQTILSGSSAGNFRDAGDEYRILVKVKDADRRELDELLDQTLLNAEGEPVVLRNVVQVRAQRGPMRVDRKNQERVVYVSANIADRDMGAILKDAQDRMRNVPRPHNFSIVFAGDYEEQQKSNRELLLSLCLALIMVYMVMACQYESLRDPFVVMFAVPLAIIGVVVTLFLTHTTFNLQSYIGCIMLGGIVVNNAIVLVDHTNLLRRRDGMTMRAAIEESGRRRLRPILMTTLTTVLGLMPLALALGEGAEAQAPLARAVIGGLLSATLITLVVIPVVYSLFERGHETVSRTKGSHAT